MVDSVSPVEKWKTIVWIHFCRGLCPGWVVPGLITNLIQRCALSEVCNSRLSVFKGLGWAHAHEYLHAFVHLHGPVFGGPLFAEDSVSAMSLRLPVWRLVSARYGFHAAIHRRIAAEAYQGFDFFAGAVWSAFLRLECYWNGLYTCKPSLCWAEHSHVLIMYSTTMADSGEASRWCHDVCMYVCVWAIFVLVDIRVSCFFVSKLCIVCMYEHTY